MSVPVKKVSSFSYQNAIANSVLVGGAISGVAKLWSMPDAKKVATLKGHTERLADVQFSPVHNLLATVSADRTARLWNTEGTQLVLALSFSANGYYLATGGEDNTCRILDLRKRNSIYTIPAHSNLISQVKFEPQDGYFLVTASYDLTAKIWSARDLSLSKCSLDMKKKLHLWIFQETGIKLLLYHMTEPSNCGPAVPMRKTRQWMWITVQVRRIRQWMWIPIQIAKIRQWMRIRTCSVLDRLSKDDKELAGYLRYMDYSETVLSKLKLLYNASSTVFRQILVFNFIFNCEGTHLKEGFVRVKILPALVHCFRLLVCYVTLKACFQTFYELFGMPTDVSLMSPFYSLQIIPSVLVELIEHWCVQWFPVFFAKFSWR
ncbi:hypothetical protein C1H46_008506 [Malus baccata]|uniref:Uncharacterized protein n=1 Tax=Malus baccata TaxID=106549 RepID=A0A540N5J3_MALBA|nr:hypothetical protein C1H46_008506 [Malus baccata]